MARPELEAAIEAESNKAEEAKGWGCDALFKCEHGRASSEEPADRSDCPDCVGGKALMEGGYTEVTVFNDNGFREVNAVARPIERQPRPHARDITDEFLGPTIEEVRRRRKARGL